jgi:hypothetical protein
MTDKPRIETIIKALKEMAALGLIEDTGQRRNGQVVYRRTELFLRMIKSGALPSNFDSGEQ